MSYTSSDIQVLSDRDHVRLRPHILLGSTDLVTLTVPDLHSLNHFDVIASPATFKCLCEIIDNCVDEFVQHRPKHPTITIEYNHDGLITVHDNGRGIPIDMHETGVPTPQVVFTQLRSGRNFKSNDVGVIGMNGVGSSAVAYVSTSFNVTIRRDGKLYQQIYLNGCETIDAPTISAGDGKSTGTSVSYRVDPSVLPHATLPIELVRARAKEVALCNPGLLVVFREVSSVSTNDEQYCYVGGICDIVKSHDFKFEINTSICRGSVVIKLLPKQLDTNMCLTWVNSSYLYEGGKVVTQLINATTEQLLLPQVKRNLPKHLKTITDVKYGLVCIADLKIKDPKYDSQVKTRMVGPCLRQDILDGMVKCKAVDSANFSAWVNNVTKLIVHMHDKVAVKQQQQNNKKTGVIPGFMDATGRDRSNSRLLIVEGLSAKAFIAAARDPETTGAYALTGKINNVYNETVSAILKMEKLTKLQEATGLIPGVKLADSDLRFAKICIASDADTDGGDITTLLVNYFYKFWPEMFDPANPLIYKMVMPNVVVRQRGQIYHYKSRSDFEKSRHSHVKNVEYMKGLGSMLKEDWKKVLSNDEYMVPIVDDGTMGDVLRLLFDVDAAKERTAWLEG